MTESEITKIFEPVFADALARLGKRTKANTDDVVRIFTPVFQSVARAAGGDNPANLATWAPEEVTEARLRATVTEIVAAAAPKIDLEYAAKRTAELEAEMERVTRTGHQLPSPRASSQEFEQKGSTQAQ